jgi:predicted dinucleotide-binding enzyme
MDESIKGGTMKVGVLGTGMVGKTIATKLVELGHAVTMGSRSADGEALQDWLNEGGRDASGGTFADAASAAELVFNCTAGVASLDALAAAGAGGLGGKTLVDVANPLDFSHGMPPLLSVCNDDSLGEQIQAAYPAARVVKALNTMNHLVMTDPGRVPGDHDVFICGNDEGAKSEVMALLESFGWPAGSILDLGDIGAARGTEMYLPLWLRLYGAFGTGDLNIKVKL